ncbi:hypothetical protein QE422_000853 [Chryseobacterium sp. SORGH_AS 447]|nr:hypothetical protein [Chryseobacterium sp. SORGH_AS_0447]
MTIPQLLLKFITTIKSNQIVTNSIKIKRLLQMKQPCFYLVINYYRE